MNVKQDFFISHASEDKPTYVLPLADCLSDKKVTYWLDSIEIAWGDPLALSINDGLRESHHVIICLSEAFLKRPWPEAELNAAFTETVNKREKKVLPLILNSKERVLSQYPLIGSLAYREYSQGVETLADELATISARSDRQDGLLHIFIESIHTGRISNLAVSARASISWLTSQATQRAGLRQSLDTGGFQPYRIRWVLVDQKAEAYWREMSRIQKSEIQAVVMTENGITVSTDERDRLEDIGVYNDEIFHLYAVEDLDGDEVVHYCLNL